MNKLPIELEVDIYKQAHEFRYRPTLETIRKAIYRCKRGHSGFCILAIDKYVIEHQYYGKHRPKGYTLELSSQNKFIKIIEVGGKFKR